MTANGQKQTRRMLGLETEYGLVVKRRGQGRIGVGDCTEGLMAMVREHYPSLPSLAGPGLFLGNGARFYIDQGGHPEFCTPEVDNPWDVVRFMAAGDDLLRGLAMEWGATHDGAEVLLFKSNVDYSGTGATWACHENYGHRANLLELPAELVPHFVSRIIYSGAGGLNPFAPGLEFCLSPRAWHLEQVISPSSTGVRGIYHAKDEPLGGHGWQRLHVLCGESLCSQMGNLLKLGTTALILALAEAGARPGAAVQLRSPLQAMRLFNADPTCRAKAELAEGGTLSALEIQRHYLQRVEAHLGRSCLPAWARRVCRLWREMLDRLEHGVSAVNQCLDWAIKHSLYLDHARHRGLSPETISHANQLIARLCYHSPELPRPGLIQSDLVRRAAMLAEANGSDLSPLGQGANSAWPQVETVLALRAEWSELEVRFSQLNPNGLFRSLDDAGLLTHRLPEIGPAGLRRALREPPSSGRARWRGRMVQQLATDGQAGCDWAGVWNAQGEMLDLSNPFQASLPAWTRPSFPPEERPYRVAERLDLAKQDYDRGNYERAWLHLRSLVHPNPARTGDRCAEVFSLLAWIHSRRGFHQEALDALSRSAASRSLSFDLLLEHMALHRFHGLAPGTECEQWMRKADDWLEQGLPADPVILFAYRGHKGCYLRHQGRLPEAKSVLLSALADQERRQSNPRLFARTLADLAEVHRLQGDPQLALPCLQQAELLQTQGQFLGDLADYTLLQRAKLETDPAAQLDLLDRAETIQQHTANRVGLARTRILEARLWPDRAQARQSHSLLSRLERQVPGLHSCPLFQKFMRSWDPWCQGTMPETETDRFWGV